MNGKSQKIMNVFFCILLILCLFEIRVMNDELTHLRNTVNNNYSSLNHSINAISNNVRNQMEEANNLLGDSGWSTGGLNIEDKTATLSCYVVPKVYNPKETVASIVCNGEAIPMKLEQGRYIAEITLPLFEQTVISNVQFSENGTIRTQQLNWSIHPRYDMLPSVYMYYSGGTRHDYKGDIITRTYTGYAEMDYNYPGFNRTITDTELVILLNGEEVMRSNPVLEELIKTEDYASYRTEIEQSFEVKQGDTIKMYMTVTDDNGWMYRGVLEDITIEENGEPIPDRFQQAEANIYDIDGKLLFEAEKY